MADVPTTEPDPYLEVLAKALDAEADAVDWLAGLAHDTDPDGEIRCRGDAATMRRYAQFNRDLMAKISEAAAGDEEPPPS